MELKDKDRRWLSEKISKTVEASVLETRAFVIESIRVAIKPTGWRRAGENIRAFGVPVAIFAVIITLFGITLGALYTSFAHVKEDTQFRAHTEDRLIAIEGSLLVLRGKAVVAAPVDLASETEAKTILAAAKKASIPLPAPLVEQAGKKFIEAANSDPHAWPVAVDFINYRSSLNPTPAVTQLKSTSEGSPNGFKFYLATVEGKPLPDTLFPPGFVPIEKSARMQQIGVPVSQKATEGFSLIWLRGGAIALDGMAMRHILFEGVEVHYSGSTVFLQDVRFVHCAFVFDNGAPQRALGSSILAEATVDFKTSAGN